MTAKTPVPHLIENVDEVSTNPHNPRVCDRCGLPETRIDVHTLPSVPAEVAEETARRLGGDR